MKLVPVVEVTDPRAFIYSRLDDRRQNRPIQTEADLIAAAAPPGEVHLRCMLQEIEPGCSNEIPEDSFGCSMCTMPPEHVEGFFNEWRKEWARNLAAAGVEWDPEIRL